MLEIQLTPEEEREVNEQVASRVEAMSKHREFAIWLNHGKREIANGHNIAYIRDCVPLPHPLDDYEMKRAIEEGLL
jgi:hypothetical protein